MNMNPGAAGNPRSSLDLARPFTGAGLFQTLGHVGLLLFFKTSNRAFRVGGKLIPQ